MKTVIAGAALAILAGTHAIADDRPAATDITMEAAREIAVAEGYADVTEIEFDDGRWEVEARDADGKEVDIEIEASTGEVVRVDRD